MIAQPESRTFTLVGDQQVTFVFFRADRFGHVLRDHLLNESEPWGRVLHLKIKRQENLRQQLDSADVLDRDAAEEAVYPQCVEVLAEGITWSIGLPVYVEFVQERRRGLEDLPNQTQGYYFLAEAGFLVVVREAIVRTAWFERGIKKNPSRVELFRDAWKQVQLKIIRTTEYLDAKDQEYVRHVSVRPVSAENWTTCPV